MHDRAAAYCRLAGQKAEGRWAFREAAAFFEKPEDAARGETQGKGEDEKTD